ncbi:MAG: hypothetical protein AAGJ46_15070 [Planctomycetota bacterium]
MLASLMANGMFALGCGLLTAILLRRSYRYFGRRGKKRKLDSALVKTPRPKGTSPANKSTANQWTGAHTDAAARIERQKVELHEMEREVSAKIDNKLMLMQQLVAQSQQQIDRLEALLARAESHRGEDSLTPTRR